jgi:hypothetical protein
MQRSLSRHTSLIHAGWQTETVGRSQILARRQTDRESHLAEAIVIISKIQIQTVMPDGRK